MFSTKHTLLWCRVLYDPTGPTEVSSDIRRNLPRMTAHFADWMHRIPDSLHTLDTTMQMLDPPDYEDRQIYTPVTLQQI